MLNFQKGEIATVLTLIGLGVMAAGAFLGARLGRQQSLSKASGGHYYLAAGAASQLTAYDGSYLPQFNVRAEAQRQVMITSGTETIQAEYAPDLPAYSKTLLPLYQNVSVANGKPGSGPGRPNAAFSLTIELKDQWVKDGCPRLDGWILLREGAGTGVGASVIDSRQVSLTAAKCPGAPPAANTPTPTQTPAVTSTPTPTLTPPAAPPSNQPKAENLYETNVTHRNNNTYDLLLNWSIPMPHDSIRAQWVDIKEGTLDNFVNKTGDLPAYQRSVGLAGFKSGTAYQWRVVIAYIYNGKETWVFSNPENFTYTRTPVSTSTPTPTLTPPAVGGATGVLTRVPTSSACNLTAPSGGSETNITQSSARLNWAPASAKGVKQMLYAGTSQEEVLARCPGNAGRPSCIVKEENLSSTLNFKNIGSQPNTNGALLSNTIYYWSVVNYNNDNCYGSLIDFFTTLAEPAQTPAPTAAGCPALGELKPEDITVMLAAPACYPAPVTGQSLPDANGDGAVNTVDLTLVRNSLGAESGDSQYRQAYDVNADGTINGLDVSLVLRALIRL